MRRAALAFVLAGFVSIPVARAATLTVTNLNDSGPGSLRQAIAAAAPDDTIVFSVTGTISLTSGQLVILKNLVITGPGKGALLVDAGLLSPVARVGANTAVTLRDMTLRRGKATASPGCGGLFNEGSLTLERVVVEESVSVLDGGVGGIGSSGTGARLVLLSSEVRHNSQSGLSGVGGISATNLEIENSRIERNGAEFGGVGGIRSSNLSLRDSVVSSNGAYFVGGIETTGQALIEGSTISENNFDSTGAGGILNYGTLEMVNTTVSGNYSPFSFPGGFLNSGTLTATSCTFTGNIGASTRSGLISTGTFTARNSIFARNWSDLDVPRSDFDGTFTSAGHNLLMNMSGATIVGDPTGNIYGVDPLLGPLADNGGPTPTHAAGPPVIDAGDNTGLPETDQRGFPRIVDGNGDGTSIADIGAYERFCFAEVCNGRDDNCDGVLPASETGTDADGDGGPDGCDCAPANASVIAAPPEIQALGFSDATTLGWNSGAPQAGTGIVYDVTRGRLGASPGHPDPAESCFASALATTTLSVADVPAAGSGFYFHVRGRTTCGIGTYGFTSDGDERPAAICP